MKKIQLILTLLAATGLGNIYAQDINYLAWMDKALYMEYAEVKMEIYKNEKILKSYEMELYRKGEKMRMEFTGPAVEKGRRMLNDESNLWMYMPRTSKVMKLPLKQAFMGSDASNRDLMRMAFEKDYDLAAAQPGEDGRLVLELMAKDLSVSYHKMAVTFDIKRQVPLKQEMFSISGKLLKTMEYTYVNHAGGGYSCDMVIIRDELLRSSLTKMYYRQTKRKNNKADVFFTLGSLKQ